MVQESVILKRNISWVQGVALTVGAVLGSGVLVLPVLAADLAGPASLLSWLIMGLLTVPLVITLGKLSSRHPDAGGIAAYARQAFGETASAVTGWLFLGTVPIGAPVAALIGANYLGAYLSLNAIEVFIVAAVTLLMAVLLNYRGISLSGRVQLLVVGLIALILLIIIATALPEVDKRAFTPFAPLGWIPVGVAMTVLFWAFVGWEMIGHLAEEFKNPGRDIQISLGVSLVIVNLLYILLAFVIIGTRSYLAEGKIAALTHMASRNMGEFSGAVVAILGFIACYGTIHTYVAGFSRLVFAQSRQGYFHVYFSDLHPVYHTPHRVLLSLLPVFFTVLLIYYGLSVSITVLIQFTSAIFIVLYIIAMASAVKLLKKAVFYRYCAVVSLMVCLGIYGFTGWSGLYPVILGAVGLYLGRRKQRLEQNINNQL
ncbi:amino acid permease [Desulfocucumis palustris]|uniref:Amino acid permease n=1 Tax=Desulfocucumis palustris TaxID=1898651 RepID=A0A2L2XCB0_9FIRM|nr:amino acid permease [Desulfocucumis palustris]GBF33878.1 amino acid permease [Desulfocucumis palustris]